MFEIKNWLKELEEITSWMPNFVFEIAEWQALNLAINWIISSANSG